MIKATFYELKRAVCSWLFFVMLSADAAYGWYVLTTDIIRGAAYTSPFSVWSFCTFTGKMLPLEVIIILLTEAHYYSIKQKKTEVLIMTAPVSSAQVMFMRSSVLFICFIILTAVTCTAAFVFYACFFGYYEFYVFIVPLMCMILPCFLFISALGHLIGRIHQWLIFLVIFLIFAAGLIHISNQFDLFSSGFFSDYPLTLPANADGEPDFCFDSLWLGARGFYVFAGIAFTVINIKWENKPRVA